VRVCVHVCRAYAQAACVCARLPCIRSGSKAGDNLGFLLQHGIKAKLCVAGTRQSFMSMMLQFGRWSVLVGCTALRHRTAPMFFRTVYVCFMTHTV
jgi:hypothetical protein